MLASFSGNIASLVSRLGRPVTIRTFVNSGPDFDPTRTPTDTPATAAVFDFEASEVDGSIIQANDKELVFSSTVPVTKQATIIDGSIEYVLINVEEVGPGGDVLMYVAQGRA
jgi:hypothetical protein